ncbi:MAG: NAD(P)H-dependent oxidoreductase subunit E [Burkholderiales bacterium]
MSSDSTRRRDARAAPRSHPRGRPVDPAAAAEVARLCRRLAPRRDLLIEHLHRIQDALGHLPARHLCALAERLKLAPVEVFEVATFYHHFDVVDNGKTPPPPLTVRVCDSLSCAMAGGEALLDSLRATTGRDVRVVAAPCVGRCDRAPVALVGERPVEHAAVTSVTAAIASGRRRAPSPRPVGYAAARAAGVYDAYVDLVRGRWSRDAVLAELEASGLRGLGGAGFPAARKWRSVAGEAAPRYLAVNADEGEPGTFKDRRVLEHEPHLALAGALVAAAVVGIEAIWIYVRDEYAAGRAALARELAALAADPPVPGVALPAIELRRGAGAYICGEESAMIESIEGRRGLPRLRPPYVAQRGLFGRPTLEHNLETLAWVPVILSRGGDWYARQGRRGRKGLRAWSLSGRVRRPGVVFAPAGVTARELIDEFGGGMLAGHELYAYLPGGASGGILPASLADLPLDFDTLAPYGCFVGSGALIVLSQHDRATDAARNVLRFFRDESCGQCTPCRAGTAKAVELMKPARWDRALLESLARTMADASICGLGQAAPNPIRSVLARFGHELDTDREP